MQLGHYQVLGEIARGGMGVVYRAHDPGLGREVAIKLLHGGRLATPRQRARFQAEAEALARLSHPYVVRVHAVGEHQGNPYLVMDLIEGSSLQARLVQTGPLPPEEAARLVGKLARALAHAHAEGVLHRDVKPDNVLLTSAGEPLLTDFGLARLDEGGSLTRTGALLGTPGYWSPEQALGQTDQVGPATDVYGLGALLYACLTGDAPFVGSAHEVIEATCSQAPRAPGPEAALDRICLRCLEKAPDDRYPSAAYLAEALESYQPGSGAPRRWVVGALVALVAAAALLGALALTLPADSPTPHAPESERSIEGPTVDAPSLGAAQGGEAAPEKRALPPLPARLPLAVLDHEEGKPGIVRARFLGEGRAVTFAGVTRPGGVIRLWDVSTPTRPRPLRTWRAQGSVEDLRACRGGFVAVEARGAARRLLMLEDPAAGELDVVAKGGEIGWPLALSADGRYAATPLFANIVQARGFAIWNLATRETRIHELRRPSMVQALVFLPDGRLAVALDVDQLSLIDLESGEVTSTNAHVYPKELSLQPSSERLWIGNNFGRVLRVSIGDPATEQGCLVAAESLAGELGSSEFTKPNAQKGTLQDLAFSPDGDRIYTLSGNSSKSTYGKQGELRVWDTASGECLGGVTDWPTFARSVDLSPDGRWVLLGSVDEAPRVEAWSVAALTKGLRTYAEATKPAAD